MIAEMMPSQQHPPVREGEPIYYKFEDDFVANNIKCIPMIARFKMDAAGIKLKLAEWSKFALDEKRQLSEMCCFTDKEVSLYRNYLAQLIMKRTGNIPTDLPINLNPVWANTDSVDELLQQKAKEYNWWISIEQWRALNNLQRFALLKLYRPGHENKNFPKAMREFNLVRDN